MPTGDLRERLEALGRSLAEREAPEREALARARRFAEELHGQVAAGLAAFHQAVAEDLPELRVELSPPRPDEKHLRSVQFDLRRGRHVAIVTAKSRGEVTLVGPFQSGKAEGPCRRFPFEASAELEKGLGDFLERFCEAAGAP